MKSFNIRRFPNIENQKFKVSKRRHYDKDKDAVMKLCPPPSTPRCAVLAPHLLAISLTMISKISTAMRALDNIILGNELLLRRLLDSGLNFRNSKFQHLKTICSLNIQKQAGPQLPKQKGGGSGPGPTSCPCWCHRRQPAVGARFIHQTYQK